MQLIQCIMNPTETISYIKLDTIASTANRNSNWRLRKDRSGYGWWTNVNLGAIYVYIIYTFFLTYYYYYHHHHYRYYYLWEADKKRNWYDNVWWEAVWRGVLWFSSWGGPCVASAKTVSAASGLPVSAGAACRDQFPREHACPRR